MAPDAARAMVSARALLQHLQQHGCTAAWLDVATRLHVCMQCSQVLSPVCLSCMSQEIDLMHVTGDITCMSCMSQEIYTEKLHDIQAQVEERRFVLEDHEQHEQDQMKAMYPPPTPLLFALLHGVVGGANTHD